MPESSKVSILWHCHVKSDRACSCRQTFAKHRFAGQIINHFLTNRWQWLWLNVTLVSVRPSVCVTLSNSSINWVSLCQSPLIVTSASSVLKYGPNFRHTILRSREKDTAEDDCIKFWEETSLTNARNRKFGIWKMSLLSSISKKKNNQIFILDFEDRMC